MKYFPIILFTLLTNFVFSQTAVHVYHENAGLPFVKIAYHTNLNATIRYTQTNVDGAAELATNSTEEKIYLVISQMGFHTITDTIEANKRKDYSLISSSILIEEVCVTGEYVPTTSSQAINKITVIRKEEIINSGASTLNDILTYQANIRIEQDNVLGSGMSMSGMSGDNVKILQDGVPMIGRLDGNIDLSQINLDNVERIEIVNGPLSVNYGTNALAGTINIITKKNNHAGVNGNVLSMYESVGNYNLSGNVNIKRKNNTLKLSGGRKFFDGWSPNADFFSFPQETLADTNRSMQWNPKLQHFAEISFISQLKKWTINPYVRFYQETITNRGFPRAPYFENAFDDVYYTMRFDQGVNIDRDFKNSKLNVIAGYNYFKRTKNTYFKDLTTLNQILTPNPSDQDTSLFDLIILRATYSSSRKHWLNYQIGTDINVESATGPKIRDNRQQIGDYAVFTSAIITAFNKKLDIKPGFRYAYNTVFAAPITPSLNVKYQLKKVQVRASIAQGFRSPTLKELYFNFVDINHNIVGNINLAPETSVNFNGGLTWLKPVKDNNLLKAEGSFFYNDFQNLITLGIQPDGGFTYINIGEFSTIGGQGALSYTGKKLRVQTNFTYIGRFNIEQSEDLPKYIYSPEIGTTASYKLFKNKMSVNAFYKYNGKLINYSVTDDGIRTNTLGDYHILDLSITSHVFGKNLTIVCGAKNLLNVQNINVIGTNAGGGAHSAGSSQLPIGRGTSVFLSLNYKFKHYTGKP